MELAARLKQHIARLCESPRTRPVWMQRQISQGLRDHYGPLAIGFAADLPDDPGRVQLTGLCDLDGEVVLPLRDGLTPPAHYPRFDRNAVIDEQWSNLPELEGATEAVAAVFAQCHALFMVDWLVEQPSHWHLVILSPIHAPPGNPGDRGLVFVSNMLAVNVLRALDKARLAEANRWIEREMDEIVRLQQSLRPINPERIEGVTVAIRAINYRYAGGDYFDLPRLTHRVEPDRQCSGRDHFGLLLADVAGHGPSAAVEAAMLDAILRTYRSTEDSTPATLAEYVNQHMMTQRPRSAFISAILASYDPNDRTLRYVNAGHPEPLLYRAGQHHGRALDKARGIPLGVDREARWSFESVRMRAGDCLVVYTDGLTETRSPTEEQFGLVRLAEALDRSASDPEAMLNDVSQALDDFSEGQAVQDDQTLIVVRFDD